MKTYRPSHEAARQTLKYKLKEMKAWRHTQLKVSALREQKGRHRQSGFASTAPQTVSVFCGRTLINGRLDGRLRCCCRDRNGVGKLFWSQRSSFWTGHDTTTLVWHWTRTIQITIQQTQRTTISIDRLLRFSIRGIAKDLVHIIKRSPEGSKCLSNMTICKKHKNCRESHHWTSDRTKHW